MDRGREYMPLTGNEHNARNWHTTRRWVVDQFPVSRLYDQVVSDHLDFHECVFPRAESGGSPSLNSVLTLY